MSDKQKKTEITPLTENLRRKFSAEEGFSVISALGETTLELPATRMIEVLTILRDDKSFAFSQLIDLAGVDYLGYAKHAGKRFATVYHLLSLFHNNRLRVRVFCPDDGFPLLDSTTSIWPAAGWFEREAFDLFGIAFRGHEDLRRILTDYGFVGHPFRKDFPISGYVEMRYDPERRRVVYEPVSIAPREITPRIVREESFGKEKPDG